MKIMLVTRVYPTHRAGGMPYVAQDRARALVRAGHDVMVCTTSHASGKQEEDDHGVRILYFETRGQEWSKELAAECTERVEDWQPDVIHLDSFDASNSWWMPWQEKTSITLHGFGFGAFLTQWNLTRMGRKPQDELVDNFKTALPKMMKEAELLSKVRAVIGVSQHEVRMLEDQYGLPNVRLVYNPIAPEFFAPLSDAKPIHFIFSAVSGQEIRGLKHAEDACRRVGVDLCVPRGVVRCDMPAVYDHAYALLLPTAYAQGYDLAVAEAHARGVPVVMTRTGSYRDEFCEADGHIVPGYDERSGLELILSRSEEKVQRLRKWARTHADCKHRPEVHVREWLGAVAG